MGVNLAMITEVVDQWIEFVWLTCQSHDRLSSRVLWIISIVVFLGRKEW